MADSKGCKKGGRNKASCLQYSNEDRKRKNKKRRLLALLRKQPNNQSIIKALDKLNVSGTLMEQTIKGGNPAGIRTLEKAVRIQKARHKAGKRGYSKAVARFIKRHELSRVSLDGKAMKPDFKEAFKAFPAPVRRKVKEVEAS